jgi:hypothetical protein
MGTPKLRRIERDMKINIIAEVMSNASTAVIKSFLKTSK